MRYLFMTLILLTVTVPAKAEESSTDLSIYLFAAALDGDAQVRGVTSDVDVPFSTILENLDLGFMGFVEHRRGDWSFIGDIAYLKLEDENTSATDGNLVIEVDTTLEQTVIEGFVAYRIFEDQPETTQMSLDLLAGLRHTSLEIDLRTEASLPGLDTSRSRSADEDWIDGVLGLRLKVGGESGWGGMLWADIGEGSDSSSYQLLALASYRGSGNWQFFGGYRLLNLEYDEGSDADLGIDIDYNGPMLGAAYRL